MSDYNYKFETHLHVSESSACGREDGAAMARACKNTGYAGVVVTDHFFNGNCAIRRSGSWKKRVRLFAKGYENAKREGDKIGLDVHFGFEYTYHGTDFLIYNFGIDKILAYENIIADSDDSLEQVFARIRDEGGFIIHAHPFRRESYIPRPGRIFPEHIDAVEISNAAHWHWNPEFDREAAEYAEQYNLCKVGGSDAHISIGIKGGIAFKRHPNSLEDMISLIKSNEHIIVGENNKQ